MSANIYVSKRRIQVSETLTYYYLVCEIVKENDNREYWFRGSDIARFLGYRQPRTAIRQHVKPEFRKTWKELKETNLKIHLGSNIFRNIKRHTVFISEPALWKLFIRCKLPLGEKIKKYIFEHKDLLSLLVSTNYKILVRENFQIQTLFQ